MPLILSLLACAILLAGCQNSGPYIDPCVHDAQILAPDEVSDLGFSAAEAMAWLGPSAEVDVTWKGSHSRTPPSDVFALTLGGLADYVRFYTATSHEPGAVCQDPTLEFALAATADTADGQVHAEGGLGVTLTALDLDRAELSFEGDATLADPRWEEVHAALGGDGPPPTDLRVYLGHRSIGDYAAIHAGVDVWKCDEQIKGECASWE